MATVAELLRVAPEFQPLDPATVLVPFLNDAAAEIDPKVWRNKADRVTVLLAAHALAVSYPDLYDRPVESERAGEVQRTYLTTLSPRLSEYAATRFGLEFLRLLRQLGLGFGVI